MSRYLLVAFVLPRADCLISPSRRRPDGLRALVQAAYSDSIRCIWFVLIGVAAVGLSVSVFMKGLTLAAHTDEAWGVEGATAPSEAQSEKA